MVNMRDAKNTLSQLAKRAAAGEEIGIARRAEPIARLTRLKRGHAETLIGAFAGKIRLADDFDAIPAEFTEHL